MNGQSFIFAAIASGLLTLQGPQAPTSLRVVDAQGTAVVLLNARIDYGGAVVADVQTDGIRLRQGDGAVAVKWTAVDTIRVVRVDSTTRPVTVHLEVTLRSGAKRAATLLEKGRMQLTGKTDLGDYSIDLHRARVIAPVR